jgi:aminomethyltransferase
LCCAADGGVVDDLIAYLRSPEEVFLIPNAANTTEVVRRLTEAAPSDIEVVNLHREFAILAVQGPSSDEVLSAIDLPVGHDYMSFVEVQYDGSPLTVCRTGYTGERGYELVVANAAAGALWDALMSAGELFGIVPAGLAARDTLRTEMGYPLHGQDISPSITPVQARLGWAVGWRKDAFWGRDALVAERAEGPARILRGVVAASRGRICRCPTPTARSARSRRGPSRRRVGKASASDCWPPTSRKAPRCSSTSVGGLRSSPSPSRRS